MAQEAAALQRPGSAASSGPGSVGVSHSSSASDFGSFTGAPRPPSSASGAGGDPFTASGEMGFEFVDPPMGVWRCVLKLSRPHIHRSPCRHKLLPGFSAQNLHQIPSRKGFANPILRLQALTRAPLRRTTSRCRPGRRCRARRRSRRPSSAASPATARRRPSAGCPRSARPARSSPPHRR